MRIGVIGSINMDMVLLSDRIPNKGETLKGKGLKYHDGGKGANQAVACARLGAEVFLFGKVGDDAYGKTLLEHLKENKVNVDYVEVEKNINSGLAVITVGENDNTIIVLAGANDKVDRVYVDSVKEQLLKCDYVIMQHEIPLDTDKYVIELCKKNGVKTVLNPAPACDLTDEMINDVDYITPNEHEVKLIFKTDDLDSTLKKYPGKLVVTLGSRGSCTYIKDKGKIQLPCRKNNTIDTTGAGDTFNGAYIVGLSMGFDTEKALKFANISAGMSTEKIGAQSAMPLLSQVMKEIDLPLGDSVSK